MYSGNWASRLAPFQHTQPLGHTVSRALNHDNLYLGTGPGWTLCMSMCTATQGAFVSQFVSPPRQNGPYFRDGHITPNIQMHISWRTEKEAING